MKSINDRIKNRSVVNPVLRWKSEDPAGTLRVESYLVEPDEGYDMEILYVDPFDVWGNDSDEMLDEPISDQEWKELVDAIFSDVEKDKNRRSRRLWSRSKKRLPGLETWLNDNGYEFLTRGDGKTYVFLGNKGYEFQIVFYPKDRYIESYCITPEDEIIDRNQWISEDELKRYLKSLSSSFNPDKL